jgi:hypothetical protein
MMERSQFDEYMDFFESEFDHNLSHARKELLYRKVSSLGHDDFGQSLLLMIERFNRNQLPTVDTIASFTLDYAFGKIESFQEAIGQN